MFPVSEMARSRTPLFRSLLALYVVLAASVIGALVAEIGLRLERRQSVERVRAYTEENVFANRALGLGTPHSLWEERWVRYKPNSRLKTRKYDVRTNSFGYRTPEFSVEKPVGRFRVVCIGASTTVQGSRNDTTYPAILEALLRERRPDLDIQVLNLGISGTYSDHWLREDERSAVAGRRRIDWLLELSPDVVIQYNGTNDLMRRHLKRYVRRHPRGAALRRWSFLFESLFPLAADELDPAFDETLKNFGRIRGECEKRGVAYLAATFAAPDYDRAATDFQDYLDLTTESWSEGALKHYLEYQRLIDRFNDRLLDQASRDGMQVVELHERIREPEEFMDLCHMNSPGIREMAEAFASRVAPLLGERATRVPGGRL